MKSILSLLIPFLLTISTTNAQTCEGYFPVSKGAIMETTSYNEKDKPQSVTTITIQKIEKSGDGVTIGVHSDIADGKGKNVSTADYDARCSNGSFSINMKSMVSAEQMEAWKDMTVTMDADDIEYPLEFTTGEKLKDAHLKVTISMSGMNLPGTNIEITNRMVEGKESITTPAGTFDCVKISSDVKIKNIVSAEMHTIEWLSKGNGVIRSESRKGDKLKSYTVLTRLVK